MPDVVTQDTRQDLIFLPAARAAASASGVRCPGAPALGARLRAISISLALVLAGCASSGDVADGGSDAAAKATDGDTAGASSEAPVEAPTPERPIPDASLYPLLVAEFALRRRDFDRALTIYLREAEILRDPRVSEHATHLAQFLQREREAFRAVRLWNELEPDNVEANSTLGTLLARQGRTREALPHFALVARSGEAARFPMLLNRFKALPPQEQAALDADVQTLVEDDLGDNLSLLLTHALMAEEADRPEVAMARLAPVFARDEYQEQAVLLEAKLLLAKEADDPFARIEDALEDDPSRSQLRLQYARLLATRDMDAAREQFEVLSAEAPRNADLLFSLALINHELEDNVAAKAYLRRVVDLDEDRSDEAWFLLGQISRSEGDVDEAIQLFQQVGDGDDLLRATVNIAQLQLAAGNDEELADYMDRLRRSYPPRREQLYALEANVYSDLDRDEQGLAVLDRAIDEYPGSDNLRYARSILHERSGDIPAAERDLRAIIERDPDNSTALNALGYTLANRTQRYDEARELIERALALSPNEPAILDSMGWVLYHQGEYEESIKYLTRAFAAFPDPEVAAHLGEVLWVSGNTSGAMNVWRTAMQKDPQHEVLNATLDRLGITLQADAEGS